MNHMDDMMENLTFYNDEDPSGYGQHGSPEDNNYEVKKIIEETDKAWKLVCEGLGENSTWFPKSQCEVKMNGKIIFIPNWLYQSKRESYLTKKDLQNKKMELDAQDNDKIMSDEEGNFSEIRNLFDEMENFYGSSSEDYFEDYWEDYWDEENDFDQSKELSINTSINYLSIDIDQIIKETEKAWEIVCKSIGEESEWFPKSQCNIDQDRKKINMPEWLFNKKKDKKKDK